MKFNFYPVFLREMMIFANRLKKPGYIVATIMTPLIYLVTFGLGLGRRVEVDGSSYLLFLVPGICAMSAMTNSFSGIATSLAVGRLHFKSIEEILVSPVPYSAVALGEIAGGTVRGLFSSVFILLAALLMGSQLPVSPLFYISWLITAIMFAALGVVAGFKARSHEDTSVFSNFIIVPMSFFCGTFFPIDNVPDVIGVFLQSLPLTHSVICMRAGFEQQPVAIGHLLALAGFCLISILWAVVSIRQSLK
ncbi:MAG: ABC transporter permease [Fibrobacter sp.]|nr:ABC transporter permease [Fibrobacter sp.]